MWTYPNFYCVTFFSLDNLKKDLYDNTYISTSWFNDYIAYQRVGML